jgi:hypothetical protein
MSAGATIRKVKIGEKSYPVCFTQRAWIDFYEVSGGVSFVTFQASPLQVAQLFYCTAKEGAKKEGKEFKYDFEAFLEVINDYPLDLTINFLEAYNEEFKNAEKAEPGKK